LEDIRLIQGLFHTNKIILNQECEESINSLQNYIWDKRASDKGLDKPDKSNGCDHIPDSMRAPVRYLNNRLNGCMIPDPDTF
jgi:hypothetical protein